MNKSLLKDTFREIRKSLGRFLAIFVIVALGVSFFAGIKSTAPDMKITADKYFDDYRLMDFHLLSTMGFNDKDIKAIEKVDEIEGLNPSYSIDALIGIEDETKVVKLISLPMDKVKSDDKSYINRINLVEGRYPKRTNEILVESSKMPGNDLEIGSEISLSSGTDEDILESLKKKKFTIVGLIETPAYISEERGSTSIGNGKIEIFAMIPEEVFDLPVYTDVYLTVKEAREVLTYDDEYDEILDPIKKSLETVGRSREDLRLEEIIDEANAELDKGRKELREGEEEQKSELEKAEKELLDAKNEIEEGEEELEKQEGEFEKAIAEGEEQITIAEKKLKDGENEYLKNLKSFNSMKSEADIEIKKAESQIADAGKEIKEQEIVLNESEAKLKESEIKIEAGEKELKEGEAELEKVQGEIEVGEAKLQAAEAELEKGRAELEAGEKELEDKESDMEAGEKELKELDTAIKELEASIEYIEDEEEKAQAIGTLENLKIKYEEGKSQIEAGRKELEAGKAQLKIEKEKFQEGKEELEKNKVELKAGRQELEAGKAELEASKKEIQDGRKEVEAGKRQIEDGRKQLQDGKDEIASSKKELESQKQKLIAGEAELKKAKKTIDDGKAQLQEEKNKLKNSKNEALAEFASARADLEFGKEEYDEGYAEFLDGKVESDKELEEAREEIAKAEKEIKDIEKPEWYVLKRSETRDYIDFEMAADRIGEIAKVFPVFFFLISILVSLTTMTRMVDEERGHIGSLKAMGYGSMAIASKYLIYAGIASIVGSVVGLLIGFKIFPTVIFNAYRIMYIMPPIITGFNLYYAVISMAIAVLTTTMAAVAASYGELRETPALLLRPKAPRPGKRILLERVDFIWSRLKFTQKVTARNIFRYKRRFFMTVIGISGCTALLVAGFGLRDSITDIPIRQYDEIYQYQIILDLKDGVKEDNGSEIFNLLKNNNDIEHYMMMKEQTIDIGSNSMEENVNLIVPKDTDDLKDFIILENRKTGKKVDLKEDGVILTEKIASLLHVKAGDEIYIKDEDDKKTPVKVLGITENYLNHYVYMPSDIYKEVFQEEAEFQRILAKTSRTDREFENEISKDILKHGNISSIEFITGISESFNDTIGSLNYVIMVLILSAAALAFVVLYNLTNINISERVREIATIKVLGFYDKEVSAYVYRENIILTLIGTVGGLILGVFLHKFIIDTTEIESMMFGQRIKAMSYIYSAILTIVFAALVNFVMYFKLKKIDMVGSLKSVD